MSRQEKLLQGDTFVRKAGQARGCGLGSTFLMLSIWPTFDPSSLWHHLVSPQTRTMHQGEVALGPAGLAFWHRDQVPPTSPWHRLTMVTTSWIDLLTPRWGAQRAVSNQGATSAAAAAPSRCYQKDSDASRAVSPLESRALRTAAIHYYPSAAE